MRTLRRYVVAAIELGRLAWAVRFRMNGAYLVWRRETAFGHDPASLPTSAARRRAIIDYANWCASMRALARARRG
ncbi:MAG: hypothetical protein SGJ09_13905 [Phycisphaerae bacterium]|nr:hypothetical protein [Phycisphaerae bacterium]